MKNNIIQFDKNHISREKIALCLEAYQDWRRGKTDEMPLTPKALGIVIDKAIEYLRKD